MSVEAWLKRILETPPARRRSTVPAAAFLLLALAVAAGGCAQTMQSVRSMQDAVFGGDEAGTTSSAGAASVFYVGSDAVPLYQEPGKTVVAHLPRYQKVYRTKLARGYAFVRVDGTGEEGWLNNAKLIWRLPGEASSAAGPAAGDATTPAVAAPEEATEDAGEGATEHAADGDATVAPGDEASAPAAGDGSGPGVVPAAAAPPSSSETGTGTGSGTVNPSVFNPF